MNQERNISDSNSKNHMDKSGIELPKSLAAVGKQLSERADEAIHDAQDSLSMASEKISTGYKVASTELKKVSTQFEALVKANPYTAVAASVGFGWLVGRMLRSSSKTDSRS